MNNTLFSDVVLENIIAGKVCLPDESSISDLINGGYDSSSFETGYLLFLKYIETLVDNSSRIKNTKSLSLSNLIISQYLVVVAINDYSLWDYYAYLVAAMSLEDLTAEQQLLILDILGWVYHLLKRCFVAEDIEICILHLEELYAHFLDHYSLEPYLELM